MIGTWEDPTVSDNLDADLHYMQQAKDAHFNLLTGTVFQRTVGMNGPHWYDPPTASASSYLKLEAAGRLGLKVLLTHQQMTFAGMLPESSPPGCVQDMCCSDTILNHCVAQSLLDLYHQITADQDNGLLGYNLGDEPDWTAHNASFIQSWVSAIHADGHNRLAYINLQAGCADIPGCSCPFPTFADRVNMVVNAAQQNRRIDVASTALYPFRLPHVGPQGGGDPHPAVQFFGIYWEALAGLRAKMDTRPFWIITMASPSATSLPGVWCDPDSNQSRFLAFCPVAAGAKGILWFDYRAGNGGTDYPVLYSDVPTCKLFRLRTINHYLREVLGPVVMSTDHLGVFHQGNPQTLQEDSQDVSPEMLISQAPAALCPPISLGNDFFVVGVFRPPGVLGEYYLLIVNKSLVSRSGLVTLRDPYSIGASPSVIGYVGGSAFSPIGTGTSFNVSLAGGEGRLYHLTAASTSDFALTAPVGGETWLPGEFHTITWTPSNAVVNIGIVADALESRLGITGPGHDLASGVSGGSHIFQVPQIWSRSAHITLTGNNGKVLTHNAPIVTAPVEPPGSPSWSFDAGGCTTLGGALALDVGANPTVAYTRFPAYLVVERFNGSAWNEIVLNPGSGVAAELAFDPSNRPHLVHLAGLQGPATRYLWHTYLNGSSWSTEEISSFASALANPALAISPSGDVIVAFNDVGSGSQLAVRHKVDSEWVAYSTAAMPPTNNPHDISIAVDASNNVYVAFIDGVQGVSGRLGVVKLTASTTAWMLQRTDQPFATVSLRLAPNGWPAIAYTEEIGSSQYRRLRYTAFDGSTSSWSGPAFVDYSDQTIADCALGFDGATPCIAYIGNRVAKYARQNGSSWDLTTVYSNADAEGPVALGLFYGARWISFFDRSAGRYRVVGPASGGGGGCGDPCVTEAFHMVSNNPLVRGGSLKFDLRLSRAARLEMGLFDVAGRRVARFSPQTLQPGQRQVEWSLGQVPPGAYFLRVSGNEGASFRRTLVILN